MNLWRISNYSDLGGQGGLLTAGRWHNRGVLVVYLSENPALAMLEVLVHFELSPEEVPSGYQLLRIEYTSQKGISRLPDADLMEGWQDDLEYTRSVGDEWLTAGTSVLLRVPSAIIPDSYNYLFNPRHHSAKLAVIRSATRHPYDARLWA